MPPKKKVKNPVVRQSIKVRPNGNLNVTYTIKQPKPTSQQKKVPKKKQIVMKKEVAKKAKPKSKAPRARLISYDDLTKALHRVEERLHVTKILD